MTRHSYEVPGWGVGEVWVRGGTIVQHELPCEELRQDDERAIAAVAPTAPRRSGRRPTLVAAGSPPGPRLDAGAIPVPPDGGTERPARTLPPAVSRDPNASVSDLCRRVTAHLAGVATAYGDVLIDLEWATPLQHELAAAARAIPWGEVVSYGELATLAGRPRAARAAGSFCADNRFALIVPCHRVVAADGIGGYGSAGPSLKRRLLALEGVRL